MLIVSTRWFLEYWDSSNAEAKCQTRLKATAFITGLPGKTKQHSKQKRLKAAIIKPCHITAIKFLAHSDQTCCYLKPFQAPCYAPKRTVLGTMVSSQAPTQLLTHPHPIPLLQWDRVENRALQVQMKSNPCFSFCRVSLQLAQCPDPFHNWRRAELALSAESWFVTF